MYMNCNIYITNKAATVGSTQWFYTLKQMKSTQKKEHEI